MVGDMAQGQAGANGREGPATMRGLLRNSAFRTLCIAQTISWLGDSFGYLALLWTINLLTGSPAAMGALMVVFAVPRLAFGMAAGVFVDRWDRRLTMVSADALRGIVTVGLMVAMLTGSLAAIYLLAFCASVLGVFFMPARSAAVKAMLPERDLLLANTLMQTLMTVTLLLGPVLAGITIGFAGAAPAILADAVSFFLSATLVLFTRFPSAPEVTERTGSHLSAFASEFRQGMAFIARSQTVSGILVSMAVASLAIGAINVLFVPFMTAEIGMGAMEIGLADSAQAVGMVAGGLIMGALAARLSRPGIIVGAFVWLGASCVAFAVAPNVALVFLAMGAIGLGVVPLESVLGALIQVAVPNAVMGRVSGVSNTVQSAAQLISMGAAGLLAEWIGLRAVLVAAGLIVLATAVIARVLITEPELGSEKVQPASAQVAGELASLLE
jgi:MFS family permease